MAKQEKAGTQTKEEGRVENIACINIDVGEQLIRKDIDEDGLHELMRDIASHGLLQPIGVMDAAHGRYQLLWGYRRLQAHKLLRKPTILARIFAAESQHVKSVALRENIHRLNMSLREECDTVVHLADVQGLSTDSICATLGKSRQWVQRRLAIPGLPVDIIDHLMEGRITLAAAETISKLESCDARAYVMNSAHQQRWTQLQIEECVRTILSMPDVSDAVEAGIEAARARNAHIQVGIQCHGCGEMHEVARSTNVRLCPGCADMVLGHRCLAPQNTGDEANGN